jgi:hypothetical protein
VQGFSEGFTFIELVVNLRVGANILIAFEEQRIVENEFDEVFFGFGLV